MSDTREYVMSEAWDGSLIRTCGDCSFAQADPPDGLPPEADHADWCREESRP